MLEDYRKEVLGEDYEKDEKGIVMYEFWDEGFMFLKDVYVKPDHRGEGWIALALAALTDIAKDNDCTAIFASTVADYDYADRSMKVMRKVGFSYSHLYNNSLYFRKEIR